MRAVYAHTLGGLLSGRTYRDLLYALFAMPIGIATFTAVVTALSTGFSTVLVIIGIPLLWATMHVVLWWGRRDAALANRLIDAGIEPQAPVALHGGFLRRTWLLMGSGVAWRAVVWMMVRLPLGVVAFVVLAALPLLAFAMVINPFWGTLFDAAPVPRAMSLVGGVAALLLIPHAARAMAAMHAGLARPLLGRSQREILREATERTQAAEARSDLARELHDSVGHSVTAAVLQASAARRMLAHDPAFAERALATIEDKGRAALEELDRVLAIMRDDGAAERSVHTLAQVEDLFITARGVGQPLTVVQSGDLREIPPAVDREAYRVLQESLTNTMRHAAGAPTRVEIAADAGLLRLRVENDAGLSAAPQRPGGGRGLAGLAERVRALGGRIETGPREDGGFVVEAELPYGRAR